MKTPEFSIIIPAHNEEDVIARAIDSILRNTYQNFEIIAVNDGSTDKTKKIVQELMKKYRKIKLLNFKKGHSAAFARNRGAEVAKGKILVFLDADATLPKNSLRKFKELIEGNKKVDAVITNSKNTYKNKLSRTLALFARPFKIKIPSHTIVTKHIGPCIFTITKKTFNDLNGYDEKIFYYEDEDLTQRFYNRGYKSIWESMVITESEQPSDLKSFYRQYAWAGKGITSIQNKKIRLKREIYLLIKVLYIFLPFMLMIKNLIAGILLLLLFYLITYFYAYRTSKSFLYSFFMVPLMYLKNLFMLYSLLKFKLTKK